MGKTILTVASITFFAVMINFIIVAIIRSIFYMKYQKSEKIYFSPLVGIKINGISYFLIYKRKEIDTCVIYQKYKGFYYMIGTKGIYKVGKGKIITLDQENIKDFEVSIIETLKRECKKKINEHQELFNCISATCDDFHK